MTQHPAEAKVAALKRVLHGIHQLVRANAAKCRWCAEAAMVAQNALKYEKRRNYDKENKSC